MHVITRLAFRALFACICLSATLHAEPTLETLEAHAEYVYMISVANDGRFMVTASGDNTAIVWDLQRRAPTHVLKHDAAVYAAAIRPDGQVIATGSGDGAVALWNAADGTMLKRVQEHRDAVYCLAFSLDGLRLASAGGSTDGGDTACRIWRGAQLQRELSLAGHTRQIYGVAFAPDGHTLATGSSDRTIRLWQLPSGESRTLLGHTSDVYRCEFSSDGQRLASASQDGTIRVWSVESGAAQILFNGTKSNPTYAVQFSNDGGLLAAVGDDRRLRIWETNGWRLRSEQPIGKHALYALSFLPPSNRIAVAGEDGNVYQIDSASQP